MPASIQTALAISLLALLWLVPAPAEAREFGTASSFRCDQKSGGGQDCSCEGGFDSQDCRAMLEAGVCTDELPGGGSVTKMCCEYTGKRKCTCAYQDGKCPEGFVRRDPTHRVPRPGTTAGSSDPSRPTRNPLTNAAARAVDDEPGTGNDCVDQCVKDCGGSSAAEKQLCMHRCGITCNYKGAQPMLSQDGRAPAKEGPRGAAGRAGAFGKASGRLEPAR